MPTPVGHSLAALAIQLGSGKRITRSAWSTRALLICIASVPDLDLIPGYLVGEPRLFHWGPAHSLFAAILVGLIAGAIAKVRSGQFAVAFGLTSAVYTSHLILDLLLGPGAPSVGLQVLWPFTTERFMAPWAVFMMFPPSIEQVGPLGSLFSGASLPLIAHELLILLPVVAVAWMASALRGRVTTARYSVTQRQ